MPARVRLPPPARGGLPAGEPAPGAGRGRAARGRAWARAPARRPRRRPLSRRRRPRSEHERWISCSCANRIQGTRRGAWDKVVDAARPTPRSARDHRKGPEPPRHEWQHGRHRAGAVDAAHAAAGPGAARPCAAPPYARAGWTPARRRGRRARFAAVRLSPSSARRGSWPVPERGPGRGRRGRRDALADAALRRRLVRAAPRRAAAAAAPRRRGPAACFTEGDVLVVTTGAAATLLVHAAPRLPLPVSLACAKFAALRCGGAAALPAAGLAKKPRRGARRRRRLAHPTLDVDEARMRFLDADPRPRCLGPHASMAAQRRDRSGQCPHDQAVATRNQQPGGFGGGGRVTGASAVDQHGRRHQRRRRGRRSEDPAR